LALRKAATCPQDAAGRLLHATPENVKDLGIAKAPKDAPETNEDEPAPTLAQYPSGALTKIRYRQRR
jgi:hypothetical protein